MPVNARIKAKPKVANSRNPASRSVDQIIAAVQALKEPQLDRVRQTIEELDEARWQRGRRVAARRLAARGITDADIDEMVMRSRRESRR